jgi:NADH-quinone oxidoreductase subunit M
VTYFPTFNYYPIIAIVAVLGIIVTAGYVLRVVQLVFFGEFSTERFGSVTDVTLIDKTALLILSIFLVLLGIYPQVMSGMIEAGMRPIVTALGG